MQISFFAALMTLFQQLFLAHRHQRLTSGLREARSREQIENELEGEANEEDVGER